jgi:hypothetical protein
MSTEMLAIQKFAGKYEMCKAQFDRGDHFAALLLPALYKFLLDCQ